MKIGSASRGMWDQVSTTGQAVSVRGRAGGDRARPVQGWSAGDIPFTSLQHECIFKYNFTGSPLKSTQFNNINNHLSKTILFTSNLESYYSVMAIVKYKNKEGNEWESKSTDKDKLHLL